jgi:hypothetical protein
VLWDKWNRNPESCKVTHYNFSAEEIYQFIAVQGLSRNETEKKKQGISPVLSSKLTKEETLSD